MANKTWRPIGSTGPGVNELSTAYEPSTAQDSADGAAGLDPGAETEITRVVTGDTTVLRVAGAVDGRATGRLRAALVAVVLRGRPRRVVLDLRDVTTVDALGVGTIVAGCQIAEDCDIEVVIETGEPGVATRLRDAGLPASALASA